MDFNHKVTLITGASSGIGHEIAKVAIRDGHHVILNARRKAELEDLQKIAPDRVYVVAGDLTDVKIRERLVEKARELGRIDFLFNNAGFGYLGSFFSESFDNIEKMIQLNVIALIDMTRLCLPLLQMSRTGRVINIASVAGQMEAPFMSVYVATKFAVIGFTRALNLELAQTNVTATAVCPGPVHTEFAKTAGHKPLNSNFDIFFDPAKLIAQSIWKKKSRGCEIVYPSWRAAFMVCAMKYTRPLWRFVLKQAIRTRGEKIIPR